MEEANQLQTYLLETIESRYPKRADAIEALATLLHIGKDGIYRRMRGDSVMSPDEMELLARTYNISLDTHVFRRSDAVMWSFNPFVKTVHTFEDYLQQVLTDANMINRLPNVEVMYATAEIPLFYYIFQPEIFAFKLYVWGRTTWRFDWLEKRKFSFDVIPPPLLEKANEIHKIYRNIGSQELWSLNILDNTLNQIEFHVNSGAFADPKDALLLMDKMLNLANHLETMAKIGKKFAYGTSPEAAPNVRFELYHNEMVYTNNTIFVKSPAARIVITTVGNPNFIKTTDERMCDYTENWLNGIIPSCNPISLSGEKNRKYFFDRLRRRIEAIRNRIVQHIEDEM